MGGFWWSVGQWLLLKMGARKLREDEFRSIAHRNLARGLDLNMAMAPFGHTVLIEAVKRKDVDVVRALLNRGADVNRRDENNITAVGYAVRYGPPEVVAFLRAAGATVSPVEAVLLGEFETLRSLLHTSYADEQARNTDTFRYSLCVAARLGRLDMVALLLEHGADVDYDSDSFELRRGSLVAHDTTPLSSAVYNGHVEVVRLLLAHGADTRIIVYEDGATALDGAMGQPEMQQLIREAEMGRFLAVAHLIRRRAGPELQSEAADEKAIEIAQQALGVALPDSYLQFQREFGDYDTGHEPGEGAISWRMPDVYTVKPNPTRCRNIVQINAETRAIGMPHHLIAFSDAGGGDYYYFNTRWIREGEGDCYVGIWSPDEGPEQIGRHVAPTFTAWLEGCCGIARDERRIAIAGHSVSRTIVHQ